MVRNEVYLKMCRQTVTAAGTRVALVTGDPAYYQAINISIRAAEANTGNIYVGGDNRVVSTDYSDILAPGERLNIQAPPGKVLDLTQIWLDADSNNNAVSFTALMESEPY